MSFYTGVGSRQTPKAVLASMTRIATRLRDEGYILRSGGAVGADTAFEQGAGAQRSLVYLPWRRFRDHASPYFSVSKEAQAIAARHHPAWHLLNQHARLLHGRNVYQVLGLSLDTKSDFVICWTKDGRPTGGTATAIRIAQAYGISVYNLHAWTEASVLKRILDK